MTTPDREALDFNDKDKSRSALADEALKRAIFIVEHVTKFKQPRLDQIAKYRELYAGKVKPKYRQPFNVVLPVFAGMMDTLAAAFNDDLSVDITEQEPADYIAVRKIDALWNQEVTSLAPNARFPHKTRTDRFNALFSGRGFMANYAVSDPEYKNCFEIYELDDDLFQPDGGGNKENHLYSGRANIVRSATDLESSVYDQTQARELLKIAGQSDFMPEDFSDTTKLHLAKFKAMGLSPEEATYVGEQFFKLCALTLTIRGTRYHIVFSPWYRQWVRFDKLKDIASAELYPEVSWATHEDNKNYLSKSYADDCYGVADSVHTLFNQELTNREKRNLNARAYDREMFPDVSKLDQAQYRPDALVPFNSFGGTRKINDGLFTFQTAELKGTIDLINWINAETGKDIGVTDLQMGGVQNVSKKATVILAEQQNVSKRLLLRSSPYTEAMGEIVKRFIQGAKDHLPAKKALRRLGTEGEGWEAIIRRADLDLYADVDVKITSSSIEMRNSQLKKEATLKTLSEIAVDPIQAAHVNPKWLVKTKLKAGAELDDTEIHLAMDTQNYGNEVEVARAHEAIQEIQSNREPDKFFGATTLFMRIIHDFAVNNRNSLGDRKYNALLDYEMAHGPIVQENMIRKADSDAAAMNRAVPPGADAAAPLPGADTPLPMRPNAAPVA